MRSCNYRFVISILSIIFFCFSVRANISIQVEGNNQQEITEVNSLDDIKLSIVSLDHPKFKDFALILSSDQGTFGSDCEQMVLITPQNIKKYTPISFNYEGSEGLAIIHLHTAQETPVTLNGGQVLVPPATEIFQLAVFDMTIEAAKAVDPDRSYEAISLAIDYEGLNYDKAINKITQKQTKTTPEHILPVQSKVKPRFLVKSFSPKAQIVADCISTGKNINGKDSGWWQGFRRSYSETEFAPAQIEALDAIPVSQKMIQLESSKGISDSRSAMVENEAFKDNVSFDIEDLSDNLPIVKGVNFQGKISKGECPVNTSFSAVSISTIKGKKLPTIDEFENLFHNDYIKNEICEQEKQPGQYKSAYVLHKYSNSTNLFDFSLIASNWLCSGAGQAGDLDGNSKVDIMDLQKFSYDWLAINDNSSVNSDSLINDVLGLQMISTMQFDPNIVTDPNIINDPNTIVSDPNTINDGDDFELYYADDLPYQTSFDALQGYVFDSRNDIEYWNSIDGQLGWCVDSGNFGVVKAPIIYFDGPVAEIGNNDYYFSGYQSVLYSTNPGSCYKMFNDEGQDKDFIRFEIWPSRNSEVIIANGDEIVTAIKFNFDESVFDPNDPNSAGQTIHYWDPEPEQGEPRYIDTGVSYSNIYDLRYANTGPVCTKFILDIDWVNMEYDLWSQGHSANLFGGEFFILNDPNTSLPLGGNTFDRIKIVNNSQDGLVFDRLLICGSEFDPYQSVALNIEKPCHCDYQNGGLAQALTPVTGSYMGYNTAGYSILCCPKEDGDMDWFSEEGTLHANSKLGQSFIDNKWLVSDIRSQLKPDDGSFLGWWRTGVIPNGYYYWSILVYSDITTSSGYMLPLYCYWLNDSRAYEDGSDEWEVWPAATMPVAGYQKSNPYTTEYNTAIKVQWPGEFPFELKHYYNSGRATKLKPFYYGWSCNYEYTLTEDTRFQYESGDNGFGGELIYCDGNRVAHGLISISFPDGNGQMFRCYDAMVNSGSNTTYYYPFPEVSGRDYVERRTVCDGQYLNSIIYTLKTGDGKSLEFRETNIGVELDQLSGTPNWVSEPVLKTISDRFGNALNVGWVSGRIDSISYGEGTAEKKIQFYDNNNDGMIEKALLIIGGDEYSPIRTVKYSFDSQYFHRYFCPMFNVGSINEFAIIDFNDGVDGGGEYRNAEYVRKIRYFGYHPEKRQHIIYEFDRDYWWTGNLYVDKKDIWYDDWGRVIGILSPSDFDIENEDSEYLLIRGPISIYEYDYYHHVEGDIYTADPNIIDIDSKWQKITQIDTKGEFSYKPGSPYIIYDIDSGIITESVKDFQGRVMGSHMTTVDNCGEKLTEYKYPEDEYCPNYYKPYEIKEEYDDKIRVTSLEYFSNGDLKTKEIKEQGSSEIKKESYGWHDSYSLPISQSSWQKYNDNGTEIKTEFVYGRADGTISTNSLENKYLVEQWQLLEYYDSDPNNSEWAVTKYRYRSDGQVKEIIDPDNKRQSIEYDDWGYPKAAFVGAYGSEIPISRQINNPIGEVKLEIDAAGKVTVNNIDGHGRIYQKDIYENNILLWYLDEPNTVCNLGSKIAEFKYGYDIRGHNTCEFNVDYEETKGGFTFKQYLPNGHPERICYCISTSIEDDYETLAYEKYKYDHRGRLWHHYWVDQHLGENDEIVRAEMSYYDSLDRRIRNYRYDYVQGESGDTAIEAKEREENDKYNTEGQLKLQTIYKNGIRETAVGYDYDIFGRKISYIIDPVLPDDPNSSNELHLETKYYYDLADNCITTEDPKGNITHFSYDNANRKTNSYYTAVAGTTIDNAVVKNELKYYKNGQLKESTTYDRDGSSILEHSLLAYDSQNRVNQVTQDVNSAIDAVTSIYYNDSDPNGVLDSNFAGYADYDIKIVDAENKQTWRKLDYNGQLTELVYPSGLSQQYTYYADGKLKAKAVWSSTGQKLWVEYIRDSRGRLIMKLYPDGSCREYVPDGFGRRKLMRNVSSSGSIDEYAFGYDVFDRVDYVQDPDGYTSFYSYRGDGQLSSVNITDNPENDPNGFYQLYYTYDSAGRNDGIFTGQNADLAVSCIYDDNGNLENMAYHSGSIQPFSQIENSYNLDNQLISIDSSSYDLANVTIDGLGRIKSGTESLKDPSNSTIVNSLSYSYNRQGSLISSNIGTFSGYYSYHKDGNLSARYQGGISESFGYDFDGDGIDESNMLTSIGSNSSIAWDDNGQLICDGGINFVYDYDNKLDYASSVSGPTIYVDYEYDPLGNLSGRSDYVQGIGTRQSRYIQDYSGGLPKVLVELEPDGSGGWSVVAQNYHYGDRLVLSQSASGNSSYYIHDRNGNVRNIINSSQTVLNSYSYTAFGEDIASQCFETVPNNWKFSGQYHDKQLDQYYLRARMYSPYLSRFNGYDPVLGSYQEPLTLHQYLYCLNDPVNRVDLSGEFSLTDQNATHGIGSTLNSASGAYDAAKMVKDAATQLINGVNISNIALGVAVDLASEKLGARMLDSLVDTAKGLGKFRRALANSPGHHPVPMWAGGNPVQELVDYSDNFTRTMHVELDADIFREMKKMGLKVGRKGGSAEDIVLEMVIDNKLQAQSFDKILDIYRAYDTKNGSELTQAFWNNWMTKINTVY